MAKAELLNPVDVEGGERGTLFVVGGPIGNLEDITLRAIRTLKEVDLIACEDTRRTQQLLNHYGIKTRTISYHEHNELTRAPELVLELQQGSKIALMADAGMPVISDPGYRLVTLAIRHNIKVVPVPGASAFVAALAAAGVPVEKFRFLGFLPSKKAARRQALQELKTANKTLVFYEAPHRIVEMLEDARKLLGNRPVVIAREVTKVHEEFIRGTISRVLEILKQKAIKGEITVLIAPPTEPEAEIVIEDESITEQIKRVMTEQGLDQKAALKVVARRRGLSRSEAYRLWQEEKMARQVMANLKS